MKALELAVDLYGEPALRGMSTHQVFGGKKNADNSYWKNKKPGENINVGTAPVEQVEQELEHYLKASSRTACGLSIL